MTTTTLFCLLWSVTSSQGSSPSNPIAQAKPLAPDVLLTRLEESIEAEKLLNSGKLVPSKLLYLSRKTPVVACYGRLAEETHLRGARAEAMAQFLKHPNVDAWPREKRDTLRGLLAESPFRDAFRDCAAKGGTMRFQIVRLSIVKVSTGGLPGYVDLPATELTSFADIPADLMRLAEIPRIDVSNPPVFPVQRSIACLTPRFGTQPVNYMQLALRMLNAREEQENALVMSTPLPPMSDEERAKAAELFAQNYGSNGFSSSAAAQAAFRNAEIQKYGSIAVRVIVNTPSRPRQNLTWGVLGIRPN